jgi:hypothetical protein
MLLLILALNFFSAFALNGFRYVMRLACMIDRYSSDLTESQTGPHLPSSSSK